MEERDLSDGSFSRRFDLNVPVEASWTFACKLNIKTVYCIYAKEQKLNYIVYNLADMSILA